MNISSKTKSFVILTLIICTGMTTANAGFNPSPVRVNEFYNKKITKAQCLKKTGYVWIEAEKICIRPSRGSH